MTKMNIIHRLVVACAAIVLSACNEGVPPLPPEGEKLIALSVQQYEVASSGDMKYLKVQSDAPWHVSKTVDWVTVAPAQGEEGSTTVQITIDPNSDYQERTADVTFALVSSPATSAALHIAQSALRVMELSQRQFDVEAAGGDISFTVESNLSYEVSISVDWIKAVQSKALTSSELNFTIEANRSAQRTGEICLTCSDASKTIVKVTQADGTVPPDVDNCNVKGTVMCEGRPVASVAISDGYDITLTDQNGQYWLQSNKRWGYVFMTIPGGYFVPCDASLPRFWQAVSTDTEKVDVCNFELRKVANDRFTLLAATDAHLANRNGDVLNYRLKYVADVENTVSTITDREVYAIQLGDATWDIYWTANRFDLNSFVNECSRFPLPLFSVIGNHDHDMAYYNDFDATRAYRKTLGPTYYSFDIGQVHFVVLDDVVYHNDNNSRNHDTYVDQTQLAWLRKDLAMVTDKSRPVMVAMHCSAYEITLVLGRRTVTPAFSPSYFSSTLAGCFAGFDNVHFLTGDTHINRAVAPEDMPTAYSNIFEHNIAAICASWWWTNLLSGNSICKDGSEGGYMVFDIDGKQVRWRYKGMNMPADRQFRAYDMNTVRDYFNTSPAVSKFLSVYPSRENYKGIGANQVLINVWNWDSGWQIEVTENGRALTVEQIRIEDPLHSLSYDIPRTASNGELTSSFRTIPTHHMFRVTASDASSPLVITVTDRFGVHYTQTMTRPKTFTIDMQ